MTMPAFFSAISQYSRNFKNNCNLLLMERIRICNRLFHRYFSPAKKEISIEYLYQILGFDGTNEYIYNQERYIEWIKKEAPKYGLKIDKHIFIEPNLKDIYINETNSVYHTTYKITIKNLIIIVNHTPVRMLFDKILRRPPPGDNPYNGEIYDNPYNGGTYLIFENNLFISPPSNPKRSFEFVLGNDMYLIFKDNKFDDVDIELTLKENAIVELTKNNIKNKYVTISGETNAVGYRSQPDTSSGVYFSSKRIMATRAMEEQIGEHVAKIGGMPPEKFIADIKKKVIEQDSEVDARDILKMLVYMDKKVRINPDDIKLTGTKALVRLTDNAIVKLKIENIICFFSGSNTIKNLEISEDINHLYWGPYQNIDPDGKHAYPHKEMFITFIEKAVKNNDKMQEARLRKELVKCERALLRKEKGWRSWQDKSILWWSSWISDYGTSWFHPFSWLVIINALFTGVILCFFYPNFSWWVLFAEFFNPLSDLATTLTMEKMSNMEKISDMEKMINIESNGWISSANIVQKVILALCLYEMIKIFRRFSK